MALRTGLVWSITTRKATMPAIPVRRRVTRTTTSSSMRRRIEKLTSMTARQAGNTPARIAAEGEPGRRQRVFRPALLGRLDGFSSWGSATGVVPLLDFAAIRRFLLDLLARCPAGEWLSVASLVELPQEETSLFPDPQETAIQEASGKRTGRVTATFRESKNRGATKSISTRKIPMPSSASKGDTSSGFSRAFRTCSAMSTSRMPSRRPKGVYPIARLPAGVSRQRAVAPCAGRQDRRTDAARDAEF